MAGLTRRALPAPAEPVMALNCGEIRGPRVTGHPIRRGEVGRAHYCRSADRGRRSYLPGVAKTKSAMKATLMKKVASTRLTVMKNGV